MFYDFADFALLRFPYNDDRQLQEFCRVLLYRQKDSLLINYDAFLLQHQEFHDGLALQQQAFVFLNRDFCQLFLLAYENPKRQALFIQQHPQRGFQQQQSWGFKQLQ